MPICSANVWTSSCGDKQLVSPGIMHGRKPIAVRARISDAVSSSVTVFRGAHRPRPPSHSYMRLASNTIDPLLVFRGERKLKMPAADLSSRHANTPAHARPAREDRDKMAFGPRLGRPTEATQSNPHPESACPLVGRHRLAVSRHNLPRWQLPAPKASSCSQPWGKRTMGRWSRLRLRLRLSSL